MGIINSDPLHSSLLEHSHDRVHQRTTCEYERSWIYVHRLIKKVLFGYLIVLEFRSDQSERIHFIRVLVFGDFQLPCQKGSVDMINGSR